MPSTELINGLISLVLTLLVLSLLVQALQELVKAFLHVKARHLENALRALLSKAGLCACAVTDLLTQIAVGFGRTHAVRTGLPAAKTISKKEILLWLDARPIGASITGLKPLIEAVEERLNQAVTGSAAPTFALIESTIRDFLATLPNRDEELTFERTAAEPKLNLDRIRELLRDLQAVTNPPAGMQDLATDLTKLLNAWRELTGASRRIRQNVENWFETAILAFDERYEAEMRRWTLGLGFVVAVLLDASFFKLAKTAFGASELRLTKLQAPDLSLETIPGLLITTLLLSAGAPFWRDILQSLFEVKSRLREQKELAGNLMGR